MHTKWKLQGMCILYLSQVTGQWRYLGIVHKWGIREVGGINCSLDRVTFYSSPFITLALRDHINYSSADICLQTQHFTHLLVHKHVPLNSGWYQKGVVIESSAPHKTNCYTIGSRRGVGPRGHFRVSAKHSLKLWPPIVFKCESNKCPIEWKSQHWWRRFRKLATRERDYDARQCLDMHRATWNAESASTMSCSAR